MNIKKITVFKSTNCKACNKYEDTLNKLEGIDITVLNITEDDKALEYARSYGINVVPTTIIFKEDTDDIKHVLTGYFNKETIMKYID